MEFGESNSFPKYGTGNYVQTMGDEEGVLDFKDFSQGYFSPVAPEIVPDNATPSSIDIEITRNNRLKRSPGTTVLEIFESRTPEHFVVHGSLDFTAELLFFDAPYLGVKRLGDTEWANKSLSGDGFAWANFGGTFIFTDGQKVYARQVNDGTNITELTEAPVALAYASWAGRMWALAGIIDSNFEPLGIIWSAANSDYTDWTGLGSGFELLIDQISSGDRGVALVPMGLDFMAIFLRKSIWIARRTGLTDRPGDFQPRVPSKGAINSSVLQATQEGVIYVSDNGVELFDGNTSTHISYQIDAELLPLDYGAILRYTSSYNPSTNRYYLHCPDGTTWIYELDFKRWIRRSLDAIESVIWPLQEQDAVVEGKNRVVFLGDHVDESLSQRAIEVEDQASELYFGTAQTPRWDLKPTPQPAGNFLLTSKQFNLEYEGVADIELWAPNNNGVYEALVIDGLLSQSPPDVVEIYAAKTGRLASLQLRIIHGDAEFIGLQVLYIKRGPRVAVGEGGIPGNFPDRTSLQVFPQGSVAPWTGGPGGPQRPAVTASAVRLDRYTYQFILPDPDNVFTSWLWDFGDGETSTEESPTHVYTEPGSYTVTVTPKSDWYFWSRYVYFLSFPEEVLPVELSFYPTVGEFEPASGFMMWSSGGGGDGSNADAQTAFNNIRNLAGSIVPNFDPEASCYLWFFYNYTFGAYTWKLYRPALRFDTSALTGTIISARVRLKVQSLEDWGDPFPQELDDPGIRIHNEILGLVSFVRPDPEAPAETDDWARITASNLLASDDTITLLSTVNGAIIELELNSVGLAALNAGGTTCFALRCLADRSGAIPPGTDTTSRSITLAFYSMDDEEWAADWVAPVLIVTVAGE